MKFPDEWFATWMPFHKFKDLLRALEAPVVRPRDYYYAQYSDYCQASRRLTKTLCKS